MDGSLAVVFTGVPVKTILEHAGGMDSSAALRPVRVATIPEVRSQYIQSNALCPRRHRRRTLAWKLMGALPRSWPLRLVVPGYTGVNKIKYIKRLAIPDQSAANIKSGYRGSLRRKGAPVRIRMDWPIKSWIPSWWTRQPTQSRQSTIQALLCSTTDVNEVEVSIDGAKRQTAPSLVLT